MQWRPRDLSRPSRRLAVFPKKRWDNLATLARQVGKASAGMPTNITAPSLKKGGRGVTWQPSPDRWERRVLGCQPTY